MPPRRVNNLPHKFGDGYAVESYWVPAPSLYESSILSPFDRFSRNHRSLKRASSSCCLSSGAFAWGPTGVRIGDDSNLRPFLLSDGAGGVAIAWAQSQRISLTHFDGAGATTAGFAAGEGIQISGWKSTTQTASRLGSRKFRQKAWCDGWGRYASLPTSSSKLTMKQWV